MQPEEKIQLPIFVYGTLRPGAKNYSVVRDLVDTNGYRPASLQGFQMYNFRDFPGITEVHPASQIPPVMGDLLVIKPDRYDEAIVKLDKLEVNGYLFARSDRYYADVWPKEENTIPWQDRKKDSVRAWVYIANTQVLEASFDRIVKSNDWMNRGG